MAVESVISQTYKDWELLIINDASIDHSVEIAQKYSLHDKRIRVFENPHSIGLPSAPRNYGVLQSNGCYIAFLDSDDFWFPNKLEDQLPLFEFDDTAVVFSNYEKVNEIGERRGRVVKAPKITTYYSLLKGNVIGNLTGIYDSQKVGKIKIMDIYHEDYVMWLSILKKGFVARNTNTVAGAYRISNNSISYNKLHLISWQWGIYRNILHLSFFKSTFFYFCYAFKACYKSMI